MDPWTNYDDLRGLSALVDEFQDPSANFGDIDQGLEADRFQNGFTERGNYRTPLDAPRNIADSPLGVKTMVGCVNHCIFSPSGQPDVGRNYHPPLYAAENRLDGPSRSRRPLLAIRPAIIVNSSKLPGRVDARKTNGISKPRVAAAVRSENTLEDSLIVYKLHDGADAPHKERKKYSLLRREEVAGIRKKGACFLCKLRKTRCDLERPCQACLKAVGDVLGPDLCNLTMLDLVPARLKIVEFLDLSNLRLSNEQYRIGYDPRIGAQAQLTHKACCPSQPSCPSLQITIQKRTTCSESWMNFEGGEEKSISAKGKGAALPREHEIALSYSIPDGAFPSLDHLIRCYSRSSCRHPGDDFAGPRLALTALADNYCGSQYDLPLKQLISKILRLGCLFSIYHNGVIVKPLFDDKNALDSTFEEVKLQIRFTVAQGIADLQTTILNEFSEVITQPFKKLCSISTWLCLWLLMLVYREHMDYLQNQKSEEPAVPDPKLKLAADLYNILVTIHFAVFRTSSPLTFVKGFDKQCHAIWENLELFESFKAAREELRSFFVQKDNLPPADALLKELVIDKENPLRRKHNR